MSNHRFTPILLSSVLLAAAGSAAVIYQQASNDQKPDAIASTNDNTTTEKNINPFMRLFLSSNEDSNGLPVDATTQDDVLDTAVATPTAAYLVGAGIADITGAAAETGMFAYAASQTVEGINDRLYSHAFIIGDNPEESTSLNTHSNRVVYVSADMGAMFTAVKMAVVAKLESEYDDLYNDDNVMLTATHTHVGNSGVTHQKLYQIASQDSSGAGYDTQNFNAVVDGIVNSIKQAHNNLEPGYLTLAQGQLEGATVNRSEVAYDSNHDAHEFDSKVNETMTQLRLNAADGSPLGLINWFALHPTSFSKKFMHLSADNKGYAQQGMMAHYSELAPQDKPFVAAFANADEGDVLAIGGNADSVPGYQGSDNEWENVERDGQQQLDKAIELWDEGDVVSGPVDVRARWVDLKGYRVDGSFTNGAGMQTLCLPARGFSFTAGGENGPSGIPGMYEGMTTESVGINGNANQIDPSIEGVLTRTIFGVVPLLAKQDDCQAEKAVFLPTGAWGWINTRQPFQLMRMGNLAIVSIPAEPTTMAGRRLRAAVLEQLGSDGVDTVIINGLANNYSGYLTTREEYAMQHYEGASTEFGPYQLGAYIQEYTLMSMALRSGTPVYDLTTPPDNTPKIPFRERTGVIYDNKPLHQRWGQTLIQPKPNYATGDIATAVFRGAHPKNNLRTEDTFLKVQRLENGKWVDYLTDKDFDTMYSWEREGVSYSQVTTSWRIDDDTPTGVYRFMHFGDWKNGWTKHIKPYSGTSKTFKVS